MISRLNKAEEKASSLGIGEPVQFVMPFSQAGSKRCGFWQGKELADYAAANPGPALSLGCPKIPKEQWCSLGSGATMLNPIEHTARCEVCEHLIQGDSNHAS
ncbi:MAG: hypothetical protein JZU49_00335 [Sulfuricurvum sp.]|nr:hypothetical protein [Sulfuricurvum sp.]